MKKIATYLVAVMIFIMSPISASATSAVSEGEQKILNSLREGVTTKTGQTFYFSSSDLQQAENELKINDYDDETCNQVVNYINSARQLVIDNSTGLTASSLKDLLKQMPEKVLNQIINYILEAANILSLSVDKDGNILDNTGRVVFIPTTSSAPTVKATGVNLTGTILIITALCSLTLITGVLSRRTKIVS